MSIYNGSQKLKDIYIGGTKIKEIYNGSTLVYTSIPYTPNQVLFESSTGGTSTTLDLLVDGKYQVICIAGGGGGSVAKGRIVTNTGYLRRSGGSGAGFDVIFQLTTGSYNISVGNGGNGVFKDYGNGTPSGQTAYDGDNSIFGSSIAYGGQGGQPSSGGSGGSSPLLTYNIISTNFNISGNSGTNTAGKETAELLGGASIYNNYGTGGSCTSTGNKGTDGYVKVIYIGQ